MRRWYRWQMIHRKRTTLTNVLSALLLMFVFVGCSAVPQNGDSGTADREDVPTAPTDMNLADHVTQPMDSPLVDVPNAVDAIGRDAESSDVFDGSDATSPTDGTVIDDRNLSDSASIDGSDAVRDVVGQDNIDVVGSDSPDVADAAGMCSIGGDWESAAPILGILPGFRFGPMGRAFASMTYAGLNVPGQIVPMGEYAVAGSQITLSNDNGAVFGCNMGDVGQYQLTFAPDCSSVRFTLIADTCLNRRSVVNGIVIRRVQAAGDGGVVDGGDASVADGGLIGMCALPGDFSVVAGGITVFFRFTLMGRWEGAQARANLGGALSIPLGNWALAGDHIILTNDPGASGCAPGDRGEYIVSFNADCSQMRWALVADTCMARSMAFAAPFTRLP